MGGVQWAHDALVVFAHICVVGIITMAGEVGVATVGLTRGFTWLTHYHLRARVIVEKTFLALTLRCLRGPHTARGVWRAWICGLAGTRARSLA